MVSSSFKNKLTQIFESQIAITPSINDELNAETMIISDRDMQQKLKRGEASRDVKTNKETITGSDFLVQVGNYIYIKMDNKLSQNDEDKYVWVISRHSNKHGKSRPSYGGSF